MSKSGCFFFFNFLFFLKVFCCLHGWNFMIKEIFYYKNEPLFKSIRQDFAVCPFPDWPQDQVSL